MKRIVLVTGGTGFIGSMVVGQLIANGYSIRATHFRSQPKSRHANLSWINVGALSDSTDWSEVLDGVNCVVHTAGLAHVPEVKQDCEIAMSVNRDGTAALAQQAASREVERFIYLSTVQVLGNHTASRPFDDTSPRDPVSEYARSKAEAEIALERIRAVTGMDVIVLRPPMVYGPANSGNFLRLVKLVQSGIPLPFAGVDNYRSLIFVDNLAQIVVACVGATEMGSDAFVVSDGVDVSTPELLSIIARACDRYPRLFWVPNWTLKLASRMPGIGRSVQKLCESLHVDSRRSREVIGWQPKLTTAHSISLAVQQMTTK